MQFPEKFKSGETLKNDIGPKLNRIVEYVKSLTPHGDKATIAVKQTSGGTYFSTILRGGRAGGAGSSGTYSGPFAVTKKTDTSVTVAAGSVILGLTTSAVSEADMTGITSDVYIYLTVTYSSGYSVVLTKGASIPAQSNTSLYIGLAKVETEDSKITTITQYQYGNHYAAGRVF